MRRMVEYIFTFSHRQKHPVTGERLEGKFVKVWGFNFRDARRRMTEMFGSRWAMQYESEWQAGIEDLGLVEIEQLDREDWVGGMDGVAASWVNQL